MYKCGGWGEKCWILTDKSSWIVQKKTLPYLVKNSQDIKRIWILKSQGQALYMSAPITLLAIALQMNIENEVLIEERKGKT